MIGISKLLDLDGLYAIHHEIRFSLLSVGIYEFIRGLLVRDELSNHEFEASPGILARAVEPGADVCFEDRVGRKGFQHAGYKRATMFGTCYCQARLPGGDPRQGFDTYHQSFTSSHRAQASNGPVVGPKSSVTSMTGSIGLPSHAERGRPDRAGRQVSAQSRSSRWIDTIA